MKRGELNDRLSQISTIWTELDQAHNGPPDAAAAAQQLLLERYGPAINRYLLSILKDRSAADDLTQEFAVSLIQGKFHRADPSGGRFRDYVKVSLCHLVSKFYRRQRKHPQPLAKDHAELLNLPDPEEQGAKFDESWREQLLARTWDALTEVQPNFALVLRLRASHPKLASHEMARQLSAELDKPITADGVRQTLRRARTRFAELLIQEVANTLAKATVEEVEQELADLHLLDFCRPILGRL